MEILPKQPTAKGLAEWFTGDVWIDAIARGEEPSRARGSARSALAPPPAPLREGNSKRGDRERDKNAKHAHGRQGKL